MLKRGRKAQVSLFIIIGIVLIAAILIIGFARKPKISPAITPERITIESCIKNSVENALEIMLPQGGYINPKLYYTFKNTKVAFLCYNEGFYRPCINQEPLYMKHLESEIKEYIEPRIKDCFEAMEQDYRDRGYNVQTTPINIGVNIELNRIKVLINKTITISKAEETQVFSNFDLNIPSRLYSLARVANEIVEQESKFCNFEYLGYMLVHPEYEITKNVIGTETSIYEITDKESRQKLNIAIRSCAFPPNGM